MIRQLYKTVIALPPLVTVVSISLTQSAQAQNYEASGDVEFSNLQGFLANGEEVPYFAMGQGNVTGTTLQMGSIRPTSPPQVVYADAASTVLQFTGAQGTNAAFGKRQIHVIVGQGGQIHCTWEAIFTIEIDNATGNAIFSGDGIFTIVGGTGQYAGASGSFQTLFESEPTPLTADSANATFTQSGTIGQ